MGTHHGYNTFPQKHLRDAVRSAFSTRSTIVVHDDQELLVPVFDAVHGIHLQPDVAPKRFDGLLDEPVIKDIGTLWDLTKHADARKPVSLGVLSSEERTAFIQPIPLFTRHLLDMPIKFPGTDVRLPRELESLVPVIQRIVNAEKVLNTRYEEYYAYLSFHQGFVSAGDRQREMPFHVDGLQGSRWRNKHAVNHSYLVCNELPTEFYVCGVSLDHLDLDVDDVYDEIQHQIDTNVSPSFWSPQAYELVLMDAYCPHRGVTATRPVFRTWAQLSWETRIFDRIGNTHNPHFEYDWEMVVRDLDPRIHPRLRVVA